MNYDITFINDHSGEITTFIIYNATSLLEAVERFIRANPNCTVIGANLARYKGVI